MRAAPAGHYRSIVGDRLPGIRVAFTHTPMSGVVRVDPAPLLEILRESSDEYAEYYIKGLESGEMVAIVERSQENRYYKPGELYFKS